MPNLDPRGMVDRIYKGDYKILLHTKYKSFGHIFSEKNILCLSYCKSMGANDSRGVVSFDPLGHDRHDL